MNACSRQFNVISITNLNQQCMKQSVAWATHFILYNTSGQAPMQEEQTLENQLRHQIQFYFSPVNIVTDTSLRNQVFKGRSWVPIQYFLRCSLVKELLAKMEVGLKHREAKVAKVAASSSLLRVNNQRIRRVRRLNTKAESRNIVYVQTNSEPEMDCLKQNIQAFALKANLIISMKSRSKWLFVWADKIHEVYEFLNMNRALLGVSRLCDYQEWQAEQSRYEEIVRAIKKDRQNRTSIEVLTKL